MFDDHEKVAKASSIHSTKEGANDEDDDRKFNREQQIEIAQRVLASSGWGAWPGCSSLLGLR